MEARRLNSDARDQANLTAMPLSQDAGVSDISRECTISQHGGGRVPHIRHCQHSYRYGNFFQPDG